MGVYIKGMEMPKDGDVLMVRKDDDGKTYIKESHTWGYSAELIELPPHGRLIDADALLSSDLGGEPYKSVIRRVLMQAPTVIEEERSN